MIWWFNPKNWFKPLEPVWVLDMVLDKGVDTAHPGNPFRYEVTFRRGLETKVVQYHFATEKPLPKVFKYMQQQAQVLNGCK